MQFRAKNAKNDLNPTNLVKRNFCFEMEGVLSNTLFVFPLIMALEQVKRKFI
jgi:hypothetical protein